MPLTDDLRAALGNAAFERARALAAAGAARPSGRRGAEERWVVTVPGARAPFEVVLWPADGEWECSCGAEACPHAAIAAMTRESGAVGPLVAEPARVEYRIRREGAAHIVLDRHAPDGAIRRPVDQDLNRVFAGWWGRPDAPRGLWGQALGALAEVPLTLDGQAVKADGRPVLPRVIVEDQPPGFKVRLVRAPGIDEVFREGVLRMGDRLRPIGEAELGPEQKQRLVHGVVFAANEVDRLVTDYLPTLRRLVDVEVRTARLPEPVETPPRATLEVRVDGDRVRILPHVVYGDPPFARLERDRLVRLGAKVPVRDPKAEQQVQLELGRAGLAAELPWEQRADLAVLAVDAMPASLRAQVLAAAPSLRLEKRAVEPRIDVVDDPDGGWRVHVDAGGVDGGALVAAWQAGASLVPLLGGGWRPLPADWLERHGAALAELLGARDGRGRIPRHAAPLLLDALAELDRPAPASLAALRALAGDFDAIPPAPVPTDLVDVLRPYQRRGVDWLEWLRSVGMGGILADDMGLGKTLQCLAAMRVRGGRSLVVAPTSVIRNWASEAARFWPGARVDVFHGARRALDPSADLTLTTWALLRLDQERLGAVTWDTVVFDEAQAVKNPESQVAVAARALPAAHRIAVTGTPVENRLEELWSLFQVVSPGLLGGRTAFRDRFSAPIEAGNRRARDELRRRIRPFVLRRLKQEVARDLPPRTEIVLRCTLSESERAIYEGVRALARADVAGLLEREGMMQVLEILLRMRQAACHTALLPGKDAASSAKVDLLVETLEEVVAEGHKALVFSQWTSMLDLVEPHLREAGLRFVRLDGSTRDRAGVVAQFSAEDGPPVFLVSLRAGGTGINLTAADYVFHLDPWWNPAVEDQATDRAHRIGQTRPVVSCRLIAEDTVEERILELQERKRDVARAALDEEALARGLTRDELLALFD